MHPPNGNFELLHDYYRSRGSRRRLDAGLRALQRRRSSFCTVGNSSSRHGGRVSLSEDLVDVQPIGARRPVRRTGEGIPRMFESKRGIDVAAVGRESPQFQAGFGCGSMSFIIRLACW